MNNIDSIRPAVEIFRKKNIPFALLHTTNIYPTANNLVRLSLILMMNFRCCGWAFRITPLLTMLVMGQSL